MRFHWEQPAKANNNSNNVPVYSGPQSLKMMMHITNSASPLQISFQKPHNSSSRQVTITLFYRGAQRKIVRTQDDKAETVSKVEPIALAFFSVSHH